MAKPRSDTRVKAARTEATTEPKVPKRTTNGATMIAGLKKMAEVIRSGEPLEKHFRVRTVMLVISAKEYGPDDVKALIETLKTTSMHLGVFLGVTTNTVEQWVNGEERVPAWACRYLDDIADFPQIWKKRLKSAEIVVINDSAPRKKA